MGGSGGGASGEVDYPGYMKDKHESWLKSLNTLITNATYGASPFATAVAYNPDTAITALLAELCNFKTSVEAMDLTTDLAASYINAITRFDAMANTPVWVSPTPMAESEIATDVAAFQAVQNDQITNDVLPRFKAGMRDINAVQTSTFILGQAQIEAFATRDVAKYQGELRIKAYLLKDQLMAESAIAENTFNLKLELDRRMQITTLADAGLKYILAKVQFQQAVAHYYVEGNRIKIVAKKEESDANLLLSEQDAKWDLEAYQYGANMLAAIGGGTVHNAMSKTNKTQSAIGGALSGAAAGASVGSAISPGYGTAIGAVVGAVAGALMGS